MKKEKKSEKNPELFWSDLIELFFSFCENKFSERPTFDGSAPRDYKQIVVAIRKRAEEKNIVWDLVTAKKRVEAFLELAYQDKFLSENFLLSNLNRQKDKIFFNASNFKNGQKLNSNSNTRPNSSTSRIEALRNW